jgi:hypothetical protein
LASTRKVIRQFRVTYRLHVPFLSPVIRCGFHVGIERTSSASSMASMNMNIFRSLSTLAVGKPLELFSSYRRLRPLWTKFLSVARNVTLVNLADRRYQLKAPQNSGHAHPRHHQTWLGRCGHGRFSMVSMNWEAPSSDSCVPVSSQANPRPRIRVPRFQRRMQRARASAQRTVVDRIANPGQ